jgi:hypothetical protein
VAGLYGCIAEEPIGSYIRDERVKSGRLATCEVAVYLLAVEGQHESCRRRGEQLWLAPEAASLVVAEQELGNLLRDAKRMNLFAGGF